MGLTAGTSRLRSANAKYAEYAKLAARVSDCVSCARLFSILSSSAVVRLESGADVVERDGALHLRWWEHCSCACSFSQPSGSLTCSSTPLLGYAK